MCVYMFRGGLSFKKWVACMYVLLKQSPRSVTELIIYVTLPIYNSRRGDLILSFIVDKCPKSRSKFYFFDLAPSLSMKE